MDSKDIKLNGTVAPQMFGMHENDIYIFDKINHHEGIFYKYSNKKIEAIYETQEGQGLVFEDGSMMFITSGSESTIYSLSYEGILKSKFKLQGTFYDIKLNNSGNYVCLGLVEGKSVIKIIRADGVELSSFTPGGMFFASCLYTDGDYIYAGGFDEKNVFNVLILNYAGAAIKKWEIKCSSKDRIINKIQKWNSYLILSISGEKDNMVIIDLNNNDYKVMSPESINRMNIIDFNIKNNIIKILDGNTIYNYEMKDILSAENVSKRKNIRDDFYRPYAYLMNLYSFQDNLTNYCPVYFIFFAIYLCFIIPWIKSGDLKLVISAISLYCSLSFLIMIFLSMLSLVNKAKRIEYLLMISSNYRYKYTLLTDFIIGLMLSFNYFAIRYDDISIKLWLGLFLISAAFFIYMRKRSINIISKRKDIIIELLRDTDSNMQEYIKKTVDTINAERDEKISIEITADKNVRSRYIDDWIKSRRHIIGRDIGVNIVGNLITASIDFSNRDIRYSKFTIIMDYITYIKLCFKVKNIKILFPREYNKENIR